MLCVVIVKPGFHIIVSIVWIAVNYSSDPSDLLETCTNDPNDRKDQDRWDRALLYSNDCSDHLTPCKLASKTSLIPCRHLPEVYQNLAPSID